MDDLKYITDVVNKTVTATLKKTMVAVCCQCQRHPISSEWFVVWFQHAPNQKFQNFKTNHIRHMHGIYIYSTTNSFGKPIKITHVTYSSKNLRMSRMLSVNPDAFLSLARASDSHHSSIVAFPFLHTMLLDKSFLLYCYCTLCYSHGSYWFSGRKGPPTWNSPS